MKIAYFTFTDQGYKQIQKLNECCPGTIFSRTGVHQSIKEAWHQYDALVCVMASGIVIRYIAPLLEGKDKDPAVIVMDSKGHFVISLVSGHLGGANRLAERLAEYIGGEAVLTTATDVENVPAFDETARKNRLLLNPLKNIKFVSQALLDEKSVNVVIDPIYTLASESKTVYLRPQTLILGAGCKRDMAPEQMLRAFEELINEYHIDAKTIRAVATVDLKAGEPAMTALADYLNVPLMIISRGMIRKLDFNSVPGGPIESSPFVEKTIGVGSVAEAASYLAARAMYQGQYRTGRSDEDDEKIRLRIQKIKYSGITFALSEFGQNIEL